MDIEKIYDAFYSLVPLTIMEITIEGTKEQKDSLIKAIEDRYGNWTVHRDSKWQKEEETQTTFLLPNGRRLIFKLRAEV